LIFGGQTVVIVGRTAMLPIKKSEKQQIGESYDHYIACHFVRLFLEGQGNNVMKNAVVEFENEFGGRTKLQFDILSKQKAIEVDGDKDFNYGWIKGEKTPNNVRKAMIDNGTIEAYIRKYFPLTRFIRLKKEEILNLETSLDYLWRNLT